METLQIKCSASSKQKLLNFINKFDENEIKIIGYDSIFEQDKKMLNERLTALQSGNSSLISIEDYEQM